MICSQVPVDEVSKSCQEVLSVAKTLEQLVIGNVFHSYSSDGVDHDALWPAVLNEVRQLAAPAPNGAMSDSVGVVHMDAVVGKAYEIADCGCAHILAVKANSDLEVV